MSAAPHIVRRLVFEIKAPRRHCQLALIEELSRLIQDRFGPALEACSGSRVFEGSHCRIDRLELDLGPLRLASLEADLASALARSLRQQLEGAAFPSKTRPTDPVIAQEELIEHFLLTGVLPWWVGNETTRVFEKCVAELHRGAPDRLVRVLGRLADSPAALTRLILRTPDEILGSLHRGVLGPAHPALEPLWTEFREALAPTRLAPEKGREPRPPGDARVALWRAALITALRLAPSPRPALPWFQSLLTELAAGSGVPISRWTASLLAATRAGGILRHPEWQSLLAAAPSASSSASKPLARLLPHLDRLAAGTRARWLAEFGLPTGAVRAEGALSSREVEALIEVIEAALAKGTLTPAELAGVSASWSDPAPGSPALARLRAWILERAPAMAVPAESRPMPARRVPISSPTRLPAHLAFGDAEEVHVANAGLILLWPFLPNFLAHLGLTESGQFVDPTARQRAAGLLQFVVTGDPEPREEDLTLAKVLCGIPVEEVFDFGAPVTEPEQAACESLLAAVVEQAPSLGALSVAGFRGTFLVRHGQLSSREGCWLLRVQRQTYDVVLERLPWPFRWIKLRWMTDALQVEW